MNFTSRRMDFFERMDLDFFERMDFFEQFCIEDEAWDVRRDEKCILKPEM
jgi:hypothetical protein